MIIVLTTTPNVKEAEDLAGKIIEEKFAACVQILPPMTSVYFWEGEVKKEPEHLLLIKTFTGKFTELEKFIQAHHSYDVPEIVALESSEVSQKYLDWMKNYLD